MLWKLNSENRAHAGLSDDSAFTLIEVVLVVVLLVLMSGLAITRFGAIDSFRQKSSIRRFINVWEMLHQEARGRGESYRLNINLEHGTYSVRREVPVASDSAKQVDYLKNFRLKSEVERRAKDAQSRLPTLEEEFREEESRQGDALENLFYRTVFRDPQANIRLGVPLEFPSLRDEQELTLGVRVRDVTVGGEEIDQGEAAIRFSASGATEFAVVHFLVEDSPMTAVMNPATGKVALTSGDQKFAWGAK